MGEGNHVFLYPAYRIAVFEVFRELGSCLKGICIYDRFAVY